MVRIVVPLCGKRRGCLQYPLTSVEFGARCFRTRATPMCNPLHLRRRCGVGELQYAGPLGHACGRFVSGLDAESGGQRQCDGAPGPSFHRPGDDIRGDDVRAAGRNQTGPGTGIQRTWDGECCPREQEVNGGTLLMWRTVCRPIMRWTGPSFAILPETQQVAALWTGPCGIPR